MSFANADLASLFAERTAIEDGLAEARNELEAKLAPKKTRLEEVNADILRIGVPLASAVYQREGKPDGTIKFASGDHIFKSVIGKTVSYDSEMLREIATSIPWQQAQEIFKIKLDVSETTFKKLEDQELKQRIMAARTVKYGEPKISLAE